MQVDTQPRLLFHGVDIVSIKFDLFSQPEDKLNIMLKCVPKVQYPLENKNRFNILMDITINDERYFIIELKALGKFEVSDELSNDIKTMFVNSNAPAIMFPYIRAFVTTLTSNIGPSLGPLWLPSQFFKGALEEVK